MAIRKFARSRGLIAGVVGVFLAGVILTPAIAGHSTQHNQNQINNNTQINQQQAQRLTAQRSTLQNINQHQKSFAVEGDDSTPGDADGDDFTLLTHGPIEWFFRCIEDNAGNDEIELFVTSSEEFFTSDTTGPQAAGTEVNMESYSETTGTQELDDNIDNGSVASELDGTLYVAGIEVESFAALFNLSGSTCGVTGLGYQQSLEV